MSHKTNLRLEWRNLNYSASVTEPNNYSFWPKFQKQKQLQILNNVNGHIKTGDLVGILGCSGAGKTTLLAAIAQRLRGNLSGNIIVNGQRMGRKEMLRISGFLPQFDINVHAFTVYEHLYFMSHFKMDRKTTTIQKHQRINDLMLTFGLNDIAQTSLQHLSGGERKRLSLAEELITDPPFLFCDEPTTGLDSYGAYRIINILRHLCNRHKSTIATLHDNDDNYDNDDDNDNAYEGLSNKSVNGTISMNNNSIEMASLHFDDISINNLYKNFENCHRKAALCTIHQPTSDIYELFTHIILMDRGNIIYQGSTDEAKQFFMRNGFALPLNCNPADFYIKTISQAYNHIYFNSVSFIKYKYDVQIMGLYKDSWLQPKSFMGNYLKANENFEKISWSYQVYLLLRLFIIEDTRNLRQNFIGLSLLVITSLALSVMYESVSNLGQTSIQDINGSIFMLSNEIIFTFSYSVIYIFPSILPILRRDVGEGIYSLSAFYMAVVLSYVPVAFLKTLIFFTLFYLFIYRNLGIWLYLNMIFILSLSALAAISYGLFVSSLFETEKLSTECAAPFDLIFLIFGGAYYNVDTIPIIKYFSLFFYTNEALMYTFWINIDNIECSQNVQHPCLKTGNDVLTYNSFRTINYTYWFDAIGLICITILLNLFAYNFVRRYVQRTGYY